MYTLISVLVVTVFFLSAAIRILNEYERGVIFRLGRVIQAKGPGLIILIPVVDKMVKVSMRLSYRHGRRPPGRHQHGQCLCKGECRHLF